MSWGAADEGGDSSAVQEQLKNVQQVQSTQRAFAAILENGSVVSWGCADEGGDRSAVQDLFDLAQPRLAKKSSKELVVSLHSQGWQRIAASPQPWGPGV